MSNWLILLPCLGLLTTASLTYGQSSEASDKYLKRGVSRLVKNDYDNAISDFDSAVDGDFCTFVTDVYLPYARENKRSYVHDEFRCKVLTDYFAGKRFSGITMLDVVRFIKHRLSTKIRRHNQKSASTKLRSPVTVHKEVGLLSSIFNMAIVQKTALENPCRNIPKTVRKKIPMRKKRQCSMTPEKEILLFENGLTGRYAHLRPLCLFDRNTGLRFGELTRLERDHFNLDADVKWVEVDGEYYEVPRDCLSW